MFAPGLVDFCELTPLYGVQVRLPLGALKPTLESGALFRLKPEHFYGVQGQLLAPGLAAFCEATPLDAVLMIATLAQLVEQQTENLRVWSSILRGGTNKV